MGNKLKLYTNNPNPNRFRKLERVMGIEPTSSAWKAVVLPLNYTRPEPEPAWHPIHRAPDIPFIPTKNLVEGEGFEPSKAEPSDLQSDPFDRSGTPPGKRAIMLATDPLVKH